MVGLVRGQTWSRSYSPSCVSWQSRQVRRVSVSGGGRGLISSVMRRRGRAKMLYVSTYGGAATLAGRLRHAK